MSDKYIEICEQIAATGDCNKECSTCPLSTGYFDCDNYASPKEAAKSYLCEYEGWEPKHGEKVLVREGGEDWRETPRVFVIKHKGKFYCESPDGEELRSWVYIKPLPQEPKWKWAYTLGSEIIISTDYYTEEEAKKKFGEEAVKLPFTEV